LYDDRDLGPTAPLLDESGSAGLALACPRRASVSALVPETLFETTTGSGDLKT